MHASTPPLVTARLVLRPPALTDAPFLAALVNDLDFLRYVGDWGLRDTADAEAYLREGPLGREATGHLGLLTVCRRPADAGAPGDPIGLCGLRQREFLDAPDLGFALLPAHRGHGLAHEAAAAVLAHGRGALGLRRILAIVDPSNLRSILLLERLGLRYERTLELGGDPILLHAWAADPGAAGQPPGDASPA